MVRLYIGGLPPGITAEELAQRFVSFGAVAACEIAPAKEYNKLHVQAPPESFPRNFGFVTLEPKDDQSLRRALQVYNGCKWRGAVMRCYVAKDSGVERVAKEIAEELSAEHQEPRPADPMPPTVPGTVLHIRQPFSRELITVTLGGRELQLQQLTKPDATPAGGSAAAGAALWEPLKAPPGDRYRYERLLQREAQAARDARGALSDEEDDLAQWMSRQADQAAEPAARPARRIAAKTPASAGSAAAPAPAKKLPVRLQAQARVAALANRPPAVEPPPKRVRTVNFMSAEDEVGLRSQPALDLSRFGDDSSDDEAGGGGSGKIIPQVDGAADSEEEDTSSCGSDSDSGSDSAGAEADAPATSSDASGSGSGAAGTSTAADTSSSGDEESSEPSGDEDEDAVAKGAAVVNAGDTGAAAAAGDDDAAAPMEEEEALRASGVEPAPAWIHRAFPAGATFFQNEPVAQMEASWRAWREGATRDYREKRRQAVRQAARPSGGNRGRR